MVASQVVSKTFFGLFLLGLMSACATSYQSTEPIGIGKPISENQIRLWNIDIGPNGEGLPPGSGTVALGEVLYQQQCAPT